jgi:hypothetical protein
MSLPSEATHSLINPTYCHFRFSELDAAGMDNALDSSMLSLPTSKSFNRSSSNPDLSPSSNSNKSMSSSSTTFPMQDEDHTAFVVKVYRSDQSFKYFPVHKVERRAHRERHPCRFSRSSGYHGQAIGDVGDH